MSLLRMERQSDREDKEEEEWKRGGERCSTDAGSFGGGLLQSACVCACVHACLRARYVPMSRDFQTSVELESIPLQRKKAPPTLVPELQHG